MDRETWWATIHGVTKKLDTTESLSLQVEYTVKSKPQLLTDSYKESKDFPVAQTVKNMPAMQETRV